MSKQYTSYCLIQKYKNIQSMVEYHKNLIYELKELKSEYLEDYLLEDKLISMSNELKYHTIKLQFFKDELKEILVRKDFNEESAILVCLEEDISNSTSVPLVGENLLITDSCCCIIS